MESSFPAWVRKRDGTTESFDPEKIHRALYAATETAGHADAFLARELADGALHFLAAEGDPSLVSTAFISDTLTKVVRELGYAWVAKALAEHASLDSDAGPRIRHDRPDAAYGPTGESIRRWLAEGKSPIGLARRVAAAGLEAFTLENVYPPNLKAAHEEGLEAAFTEPVQHAQRVRRNAGTGNGMLRAGNDARSRQRRRIRRVG